MGRFPRECDSRVSPQRSLGSVPLSFRHTPRRQAYCPDPQQITTKPPIRRNCRLVSPPAEEHPSAGIDSVVTVVDGYEHIPSASHDDQMTIHHASHSATTFAPRKAWFKLFRFPDKSISIALGSSENNLLYSASKDEESFEPWEPTSSEAVIIRRHELLMAPFTVARVQLLDPRQASRECEHLDVTIFPERAAIGGDDVQGARFRYECRLFPRNTGPDGTADSYWLQHPRIGSFAITLSGSTIWPASNAKRAKVSIHHPLADLDAVSAQTLVLAYLDFAANACIIDTQSLLQLKEPHIIDTVVSALFTVATIENRDVAAKTLVFDPPPRETLPPGHAPPTTRARRWYKRNKAEDGALKKSKVTLGALSVLELSFKGALVVSELGSSVLAGAVDGVHSARQGYSSH